MDIGPGYLSKHGYVLQKKNLSPDVLCDLKHTLTARPLVDTKYIIDESSINYPIYIETTNKIYIPKSFGIKKFGKAKESFSYLGKEWDTSIEFNGSLYDYQIEPANKLIDACRENGGGILSLETGYGKTITTLYILSQLKGKTLIVVNKIPLMNQWISEIKRFLPEARIGIIQGQKKIQIHDCDITIAMLQSLSKIDYPDQLFSDFMVTIFDEVHNISSRCFSKVLFKITSRYSIGLSATPNRGDGCEYVFKWHLGDIVYEGKIERKGKPPIIRTIKLNSKEYRDVSTERNGKKQIQFTSMISELIEMDSRNKYIVETIKNCARPCSGSLDGDGKGTKEERKILVLSDRRSHLKTLLRLLENSDFTVGLFLGGMKTIDLEKSRRCQVILATYSAFKEGISEKDLNTLLLTTPKKFIGHLKNTTKNESGQLNQIVGRIFRKAHEDVVPLIIDFQDNFSVYKSQATGRNKFYKEHFPNATFEKCTVNLDDHIYNQTNDIEDNENEEIISCIIDE